MAASAIYVVDNDSILDASSNPLGGPGTGNGEFTADQPVVPYKRFLLPFHPSKSMIWDTTPIYKWSKTAGATQYRYQLLQGNGGCIHQDCSSQCLWHGLLEYSYNTAGSGRL